jgi:hypothetical protein
MFPVKNENVRISKFEPGVHKGGRTKKYPLAEEGKWLFSRKYKQKN